MDCKNAGAEDETGVETACISSPEGFTSRPSLETDMLSRKVESTIVIRVFFMKRLLR
jgi:hypothetical protein